MDYIGKDHHIDSLVGGTARDNSGGYAIAVTSNEGVRNIVANGTNDANPLITNKLIADAVFKQEVSNARASTMGNGVMFFYLINGQVYAVNCWPKERAFGSYGKILSGVTSFAVLQETRTGEYPIVFCDGTKTHLASWKP
jgi:hypothetical protein